MMGQVVPLPLPNMQAPPMAEAMPMPMLAPVIDPPHIVAMKARIQALAEMASQVNAAEDVAETELHKIGAKVVREYRIDKDSRKEWEDRARRAMDLARQKKESKSFPWPNASNVKYPLLTTAALQFAARAYPAICDGPRIVKCQVLGADPDGAKAASADRVSQHMSHQLLHEVDGWESSVDTALHQIPIIGCAFRKVYEDDSSEAGYCDDLVSAFDFVVNQSTKSLKKVPRATHVFTLYPHEIAERQREGRYLDVSIKGEADESNEDEDAPHTILEQHRYLDLDDDGIPEPWIVTVHEKTERVLRIKACFDANEIATNKRTGAIIRIPRTDYFVKIPFVPDPDGGFYDVGFGHLLEPMSDVIDSTINQMMDAGTLQNAGGGFIGAGVSLGKGKSVVTFKPGEYRTVTTAGPDLKNGIVHMDHPGPSKVLFELLGLMIEAGKDVASVQDILVGDMPRNQTATTTMAMIEQGLKVFTAIYKRIFRAMKDEFRLIFEINKRRMASQGPQYVAFVDEPVQIVGADYIGELDIMPVADPNTVTDMQRMAKAQMVMEEVRAGNPHIDPVAATKRAFEAARIEKPEELFIPPPDPNQPPPPTPEEQMLEMKKSELAAGVEAKQAEAQLRTEAMAQEMQFKAEIQARELQFMEQKFALEFQMEAAKRNAELSHRQTVYGIEADGKAMSQAQSIRAKAEEMKLRKQEKMAETGETDATPDVEPEPDPIKEILKVIAAPKRVIRDENNRVVGVETVMDA